MRTMPAAMPPAYCSSGMTVPKEPLEAAKSGHAPAQTFVGECYLDGRGVERDVAAGETWLYRAARLGNARAKRLLETR